MRLLFIHGAGFTGAAFAAQMRAFPDALAPNLPGHESPGGAQSIEAFAEFIAAYVHEQGLREFALCGHSMGGAIALEAVLSGRLSPRALVLLGCGARLRVSPAFLTGLAADFEQAVRSIAGALFADPSPERIGHAIESMRRVGQTQTLADFAACNAFDAVDRLAKVKLPLLALTGELDVLTPPKYALLFADRVPGAQARIIPGAGHLVMVERPEETNAAIRAFVDRVS